MNVSVVQFSPALRGEEIADVAVVIDVLRATTTIATALANGARDIIPVATVEEATRMRTGDVTDALFAGEIDNEQIPGFDLGNSPLEYTPDRVAGRSIVFRTTNGTQALNGLRATHTLCAAFVNLSAVIRAVVGVEADRVALVCAGQAGTFSLEDYLCAGAIAGVLGERRRVALDDAAQAARLAYHATRENLLSAMQRGTHAQRLIAGGHGLDVAFAAQTDRFNVAPRLDGAMRVTALA